MLFKIQDFIDKFIKGSPKYKGALDSSLKHANNFLKEEVGETQDALYNFSLNGKQEGRLGFAYKEIQDEEFAGILDGCLDVIFIAYNIALQITEYYKPEMARFKRYKLLERLLDEVCESNLSKANADGSVKFDPETGKILKGENYFKPRIQKIIEEYEGE